MKKFSLLIVLFINTSLAAQNWTQIGADIEGECGMLDIGGDESGTSVSISSDGSIVAIGAPNNPGYGKCQVGGANKEKGHVRVFNFKNSAWTQIGADIDGEDDYDLSGVSVSLSSNGSIVAIGSHNGLTQDGKRGYVRVFQNINNTWTQMGSKITGTINGTHFGYSVSLSSDGKILAIGQPKYGRLDSSNIGSIGVYKFVNGTWTQIGSFIRGEQIPNEFGKSVCISPDGNTVVAGAPRKSVGSGWTSHGQVRVFRNINSKWTQVGQNIIGYREADALGSSVSLSYDGNVLAIGSRGADHNNGIIKSTGIVRVLNLKNNQWIRAGSDINLEIGDINGNDSFDNFGCSVSLSYDGKKVAIGASSGGSGFTDNSGYASVYSLINGNWVQLGNDIKGVAENDGFGFSVSLSSNGDSLAVGAPGAGGVRGRVGHVKVYSYSKSTNKLNKLSSKLGLTVYPNPAGQFVVVESLPELLGSNYSLISAEGIEIIRDTIKDVKSTLDISDLKNGVYFLKIENNLSYTKKIIKCF